MKYRIPAPVARRVGVGLILLAFGSGAAPGQPSSSPDVLQVGVAGIPGLGMQIGYVAAGRAFTREVTAYADLDPRFASRREVLRVSAGVGGTVRVVGLLEALTLIYPRVWDVHVGARVGPGLIFSRDETRFEKNQRFSLFLEPFVRFTTSFRGTRIYYAELGINEPIIRIGAWFDL